MCRNQNTQPRILIKGSYCRKLNALHDEHEQKKFGKKWWGPWSVRKSQKSIFVKIQQNLKKKIYFLIFLKALEKCLKLFVVVVCENLVFCKNRHFDIFFLNQ